MDKAFVSRLERRLVEEPVVQDGPRFRILSAVVSAEADYPVCVRVTVLYRGRRLSFDRPFAPDEVGMLTDPTPEETALAFAVWVRHELAEHVSDLVLSGELNGTEIRFP
jgi:hypothetical protein